MKADAALAIPKYIYLHKIIIITTHILQRNTPYHGFRRHLEG